MIKQTAVNFLESALNHYVQLDPDMPARLRKFVGKKVAVELTDINVTFYLYFKPNKIAVRTGGFTMIDTTVRGNSFALAKMGLANNIQKMATLFTGEVEISGDIELGQAINAVFANMEIDWEEYLAKYTGDIFAHQIGNIARQTQQWLDESATAMRMNITEYLQEEVRLMPPREEINDFFSGIDQLRNDVDRLACRVERLRKNREAD